MKLGAHMSIAGGVATAIRRGERVGCETIQIFTKNNNRWEGKPLMPDEREEFIREQRRTGIEPIIAHNGYLINLASPQADLYERSIRAMVDEIERGEALELAGLVLHPGAHKGAGLKAGVRRIIAALDRLCAASSGYRLRLLLETTAGQGTSIGHKFKHLQMIMAGVSRPERLGVCLDTCHLLAAGYEIRTPSGYADTMRQLDEAVGLSQVRAVHLNDSLKELGSRVDRHTHIGQGVLGLDPFRRLVNDARLADVPGVLETPKNEAGDEDRMNLALLRSLRDVPDETDNS
ncbi:MAG: deoxyribonuclease IV [Acidobacteria bacterium]|nr:deoxyribonuclease IV [Acidobacteriota bacterium]